LKDYYKNKITFELADCTEDQLIFFCSCYFLITLLLYDPVFIYKWIRSPCMYIYNYIRVCIIKTVVFIVLCLLFNKLQSTIYVVCSKSIRTDHST